MHALLTLPLQLAHSPLKNSCQELSATTEYPSLVWPNPCTLLYQNQDSCPQNSQVKHNLHELRSQLSLAVTAALTLTC